MAARGPTPGRGGEQGVVLIVVLFFALLLSGSIATFTRRATVDSMISRNREAAARAEALARGGVQLAMAMLLDDVARKSVDPTAMSTHADPWARLRDFEIPTRSGGSLRVAIEDSGARLNLNAVLQLDEEGQLAAPTQAEELVKALLEKVIDDLAVAPGEKVYDVLELRANLIDFVDRDTERHQRGGLEDDFYQRQEPPYRAPNRPLISVEELRQVEGFDTQLVEALSPYLTVYPFVGGGGINPNTAPAYVLALLFFSDDESRLYLAKDDVIRQILEIRKDGGLVCGETSFEGCTPISEIVHTTNPIYPPPTWTSDYFTVTSEARIGEVHRIAEAVIDRSEPTSPRLLSWRVR